MTLRVYLKQNDGEIDFIEYGLNADNYEAIIKTEIRKEISQLKTYSGSKYVGIPEIDEKEYSSELVVEPKTTKKHTKQKKPIPEYAIFNHKVHDTYREYYWVSALCSNCDESCQVAIQRKTKIDKRGFKCLSCPKCDVEKSLHYAKYNYVTKKYRRVSK